MIRLRSFQRRDLAGLLKLDRVCFPPEIAYSKAELSHFLNHPRCSSWIAEQANSHLAGFVIVERASRNGILTGHIVTLDVDPVERRRGLGRLLMQAAEERMREEGAGMMSLEVAEDNSGARGFYQRLGFTTTGRILKYYAGRIDAVVMEKVI